MHSTFTQPNATVAPVHQDHYFDISATQDHSRSTVGTSHPFSQNGILSMMMILEVVYRRWTITLSDPWEQ